DHEDDPRLQSIRSEAEQFVETDDHAIDGLIAKRAQHFARGRILNQLHGRGIQAPELASQIERLAPNPDIGADAERRFGLAHTARESEEDRDRCDASKAAVRAAGLTDVPSRLAHFPSGTNM